MHTVRALATLVVIGLSSACSSSSSSSSGPAGGAPSCDTACSHLGSVCGTSAPASCAQSCASWSDSVKTCVGGIAKCTDIEACLSAPADSGTDAVTDTPSGTDTGGGEKCKPGVTGCSCCWDPTLCSAYAGYPNATLCCGGTVPPGSCQGPVSDGTNTYYCCK